MITLTLKNFARNKPEFFSYNTKIVGTSFNSKGRLATFLGIPSSSVEGFIHRNGTVTCTIKDNYIIPEDAFYNNKVIKEYHDYEGKCLGILANAFRDSGLVVGYFPEVTFNDGLTEASAGPFRNATFLTTLHIPKLKYHGIANFQNCSNLLYLDVREFVDLYNNTRTSLTYNFRGLTRVQFSSFNSLKTMRTYQTFMYCTANTVFDFPELETITGARHDTFYGNSGAVLYNFPKLVSAPLGTAFYGNSSLQELRFPELTNFIDSDTNSGQSGPFRESGLKRLYIPKIEDFHVYGAFNGARQIELIEMKACKRFGKFVDGTDIHFWSNAKTGLTIRVHLDNKTVDNGTMNKVLQQAKNNLNATVEFYNTDGTLNSTL